MTSVPSDEAPPSSSDPFSRLSYELLSQIYFESANASLPLASPYLYNALSAERTRLTFCANIFDRTYYWRDAENVPRLDLAQTAVVSRPWFDIAFARNLEVEVKRRMGKGGDKVKPQVITGAKIPPSLLRPPWTDAKVEFLVILTNWGLRAHWAREPRPYPGLKEAIDEKRLEVVEAYLGDQVKALVDEKTLLHAINQKERLSQDVLGRMIYRTYGADPIKDFEDLTPYKAIHARMPALVGAFGQECPPGWKMVSPFAKVEEARVPDLDFWSPLLLYLASRHRVYGSLGEPDSDDEDDDDLDEYEESETYSLEEEGDEFEDEEEDEFDSGSDGEADTSRDV